MSKELDKADHFILKITIKNIILLMQRLILFAKQ